MKQVFICAVVACLFGSMSYASWQNPVFLSELNDYQNGYVAGGIRISGDENFILFSRSTPTKGDAQWEARRNPNTGLFDQQRQLSELKNGGAGVYGSWMSEDKLRLYYAAPDPQNIGWSRRPIWMAVRSNPELPWQTVKRHSELEIDPFPNDCTLTADEKCIMYETASWGGGGIRRIFTATRPSIQHNFSNIKEMVELEALKAWRAHMSPDGQKVYFRILNEEGLWEAWMGYRDSLDLPFGNFTPIKELNEAGSTSDTCTSWDEKHIYYWHQPNENPSIQNIGIYMSEWVDDSYADAVRILKEAKADKERAMQLIQDASDKEQTAIQILSTLPADQIPNEVSEKDIQKAMQSINMALQKQRLIQQVLIMNLQYFENALGLLLPPIPVPAE